MIRAGAALAAAVLTASAAAAEPVFLRSVAQLGDPRGYCLDVPGFGASLNLEAPITTHSCKYARPGFFVDQLLELTEEGRLRLASYDRCLAAASLEPGGEVRMLPCGAADVHGWRIAGDGRVSPAGADDLCLTLAAERVFVNTDAMTAPPYSSRAVSLEPCARAADSRQTWRWSEPFEMTTWNANALRSRMPAAIAEQIRAMGPVIDPPGTAAFYAEETYVFGPADVNVTDEIAYGPHARHRLQVYTGVNRTSPGPAPVIVLVHGGAFMAGGLESLARPAMQFAGLGFVTVNITYPLAPDDTWPAGPVAVGLAMSWARDHAAEYGGDPERVFVLGASAGATHVADYVFRPSLLPAGAPAAAGAILYSPNFVASPDNPPSYYGEDGAALTTKLLIGNIERTSIPVLTTVAEFDPPPFQSSAASLYDALINEAGVPTRLRQLPGHNHISVQYSIGTEDAMFLEEVLDFIATTP